MLQAITSLRRAYPQLFIASEVSLCKYTTHGRCSLLRPDGTTDEDATLQRIAAVAAAYAKAGADCVAPTDIMDQRLSAIKRRLAQDRLAGKTKLMSFAGKTESGLTATPLAASLGECTCYSLPISAQGLARRTIMRDMAEGADIIAVQPGFSSLDLVAGACEIACNLPVAVSQVGAEYAMVRAGVRPQTSRGRHNERRGTRRCRRHSHPFYT